MTSEPGFLLVVDDDENNRDMLSRRLERRGYATMTAAGGAQALALVEAHDFDLVLLDIMMPGVNGIEVLKTLRETHSMAELPVIMVTAKAQANDVVEALSLGANDYVTKPIDFPVTLARVRTQLSLKRTEDALRESRDTLEVRVEERTADLRAANEQLQSEIAERRTAEEEIQRNYDIQTVTNSLLGLSLEDISLEELLKRTVDLILSIPWLVFESRGAILLVGDDPEVLVMKAQNGVEEPIQEACSRVPFGRCLCGGAALAQEMHFAHCLDDRHETRYEGIMPHGHYCVPILFGGRTLGVITVYLREGHQRDQREEQFLTAVANTLAGIIVRRQAEEALRESEKRLKGLVEYLPEGVCLLDGERRLILENTAAREYLSVLTGGAAEGGPISRVGEYAVGEILAPREDGLRHEVVVEGPPRRIFEAEGRPVAERVANGAHILVIHDVTEERERREKVGQQDRLAAVGQLAAGIAHDFNNLLTVMMGTAQIMEMRQDVPDALKEDMRNIYTQGQRAAQLVAQILDFSRKTVAERQPVDPASFLKETVKLLVRTLPENIRIVSDFGGSDYVVEANLTQLQQVITNLSVNARDAMPGGGELRVGLSHVRQEEGARPPTPGMQPGDWVVWTVSDTGAGMPPEVVAHIYEPFFTTKKRGEGTGLGMAQVYGIVKQHNGFIDVDSEVGKGTTFTIYLPEIARAQAPVEQVAADVQRGMGESILVVEDEDRVLNVTRGMLEILNYRVFTATNGREALDIYESHADEIALVLTDMVMPDMGGAELLKALRERDSGIPVVVMTGYPLGDGDLMQEISALVNKPLGLAQVAQVVSEALGR